MMHRPLPNIYKNKVPAGFSNFHLRFHRFLHYPNDYPWSFKVGNSDEKSKVWEKLVRDGNKACRQNSNLFKNLLDSPSQLLTQLQQNPHSGSIELFSSSYQLQERMCVGAAEKTALETGMLLHPLYGLPYIPASSIKGSVRSAWLMDLALRWGVPLKDGMSSDQLKIWKEKISQRLEKKTKQTPMDFLEHVLVEAASKDSVKGSEGQKSVTALGMLFKSLKDIGHGNDLHDLNDEQLLMELQQFARCFGSQERSGKAEFFDSFPDIGKTGNRDIFELDMVNPHYGEYYNPGSNAPPADYLSPNPNIFITVCKGVFFKFQIMAPREIMPDIRNHLETALEFWGMGSRTALGYGLFRLNRKQ